MLAWDFYFWMWRQTLASSVLYLLSTEYSVVMWGACPGTLVTWLWLRLSMIYYIAVRLWSQICVTCGCCWFPVSVALSCCVGARCLGPVGWWHTLSMGWWFVHTISFTWFYVQIKFVHSWRFIYSEGLYWKMVTLHTTGLHRRNL